MNSSVILILSLVAFQAHAQEERSFTIHLGDNLSKTWTTLTEPSKKAFDDAVKERVQRLGQGDHSAAMNPSNQPLEHRKETTSGKWTLNDYGASMSHTKPGTTSSAAERALELASDGNKANEKAD